jgi:hypothetical protein
LDKALSKENIKFGFWVTRICPLNPRAMNDKLFVPSEVYTTTNNNNENEED